MDMIIKMTPLKRDDNILAVGTLSFGEVNIRSLALMKNKDGEKFLCMPSRDTGKKDHNGNIIYEEIAHPITREMRNALNDAAIESYKENRPVTLRDKQEGRMLIQVEAFNKPFYNRVGKGQFVIDDLFVIKDIFINVNNKGEYYPSYPNYKTNRTTKDGKPLYSEIVYIDKDFKKNVNEALINEFKQEKECLKLNKITIKSRLEEARKKVCDERPNNLNKQKEAVL